MNTSKKIITKISLLALIGIGLAGCLKDNTEELKADHDKAMLDFKNKYGITESDHIGDGLYLKFDSPEQDTVFQEDMEMIIVDMVGFGMDGDAHDVTDYDKAVELGVHFADNIYGPLRLYITGTFYGFYKAIQYMPEGSSGVILIPHHLAYGDYRPFAYEVDLHRVITSESSYHEDNYEAYKDSLGMTEDDLYTVLDSASNTYLKTIEIGDTANKPELELGDVVRFSLRGYYAEADSLWVDAIPGRQFFPLADKPDTVSYELGVLQFPVTEVIFSLLQQMSPGTIYEVLSPPEYNYGDGGFRHPFSYAYIIPPGMPIHYRIEFLEYLSQDGPN